MGRYLIDELKNEFSSHPFVGEVRGEGMIAAIEFMENKNQLQFFDPSKKIGIQLAAKLLDEGIIARAMPHGDILGLAPPMCLNKSEANMIIEGLKKSVNNFFS